MWLQEKHLKSPQTYISFHSDDTCQFWAQIILFKFFLYFYVCVFCLYVCWCAMCPWRSKECGSPGAELTASTLWVLETNPELLEEQPVFLDVSRSFQPCWAHLFLEISVVLLLKIPCTVNACSSGTELGKNSSQTDAVPNRENFPSLRACWKQSEILIEILAEV